VHEICSITIQKVPSRDDGISWKLDQYSYCLVFLEQSLELATKDNFAEFTNYS